MTKSFMRMVTSDAPVRDVEVALAKERHTREQVMHDLMASGDVTVMMDMDPTMVRVRVDDEFFADERDKYPSTQLVARVQLALHAGKSDKVQSQKEQLDRHMGDAMRYGISFHNVRSGKSWANQLVTSYARDTHIGDYIHDMPWWNPEPEITATVKPPRTRTRKGLRP